MAAPIDTRRIDAHHHVWNLAVRDQPWITGEAMAPIRRSFDVGDLTDVAAGSGVSGSIVVHTVAEVAETEELLDLAAACPFVVGVVGYVDLAAPDVGDQLDRLRERPAGAWLVGIRSLVQDETDPGWLVQPAVLRGLHAVAQRGLVYDLLIRPHQLVAAREAVRAVGEGRFVVDHLAKPAVASRQWEPWAADLVDLAAHDHVSAKLSGLVTEANWASWSIDDVRPYVDHAIETFGPGRLMFGSDWPVCTLAASYAQVARLIDDLVGPLSPDEQAAVFGGTATAVYGIDGHAHGSSP